MERNIYKIGKELFITSDEKIKNRDWYIADNKVYRASVDHMPELYTYSCKKIILTTDQDLINDGIEQISEDTLLKIVEHINSGKNIESFDEFLKDW